jgi:hypothetical protein
MEDYRFDPQPGSSRPADSAEEGGYVSEIVDRMRLAAVTLVNPGEADFQPNPSQRLHEAPSLPQLSLDPLLA